MYDQDKRDIPSVVKNILKERGFKDEEIREFLSESPQLTHDPFLLGGMREGVDLLVNAIDQGRKIVIYGDYDADGTTATALMLRVLRTLTPNLDYYIPSRFAEGYGLNRDSIRKIREGGGELLITVDCGIVSCGEIRYAHEIGMETIVTDHHNVGDDLPDGAVIDPRIPGDEYPFKGLAGVGVAYKLACALSKVRDVPRRIITEVLELAAIGTIADIMPLTDENRTIVKYGLRLMRGGGRNIGIVNLAKAAGIDLKKINSGNISFGLAPRINAAGRIEDASLAVKLMITDDDKEARTLAHELDSINSERKSLQEEAFNQCLPKGEEALKEGDFILIESKGCHEGILGIVAGKIREIIKRPVVIVQKSGGYLKGTGRSRGDVDLHAMLGKYRYLFEKFGGHKAACGFTMSEDRLEELKAGLNCDMARAYAEKPDIFDETYEAEAMVDIRDAGIELAEAVEMFEPCGKGNKKPVLELKDVSIGDWKFIGAKEEHARFKTYGEGGKSLQCVNFGEAGRLKDIIDRNDGGRFSVDGYIEKNEWNGFTNAQMRVLNIHESL